MKGNNQTFKGMSGKVGAYVVSQQQGVAIVRDRNFSNGSRTAAQVSQRAAFTFTQQSWRGLDKPTQAAWARLGLTMLNLDGKRKKPYLSGQQAFSSINGILAVIGAAPVTTPPDILQVPVPRLPDVSLVATRTAGSEGVFVLRLLSSAFNQKVMVYACAACSAGRNVWSDSEFRLIEVDDNLAAGGTSIGTSYAARFGTPVAGQQIAVRLRPVTDTGFQGMSTTVTAIVAAVTAAASSGDDETGADTGLRVG